MIAKFTALICLFGLVRAGHLYNAGLGYNSLGYSSLGYGSYGSGYGSYGSGYGSYGSGYGSYGYGSALPAYGYKAVAPVAYAAPVVKTIAPLAYTAPVAYTPVVKSIAYSAPAHAVSHQSQYSVHSSPVVKSYGYASPYYSHGAYAPALSYGGYGHGYYGNKYVW